MSICSLILLAMAISIARTTKGNNSKGPGPMALIFFPTIQLVILSCVQNLKFLGKVVPEISLTQINAMAISIARTTKGNNSKGPGPMALIFFPIIQLVILSCVQNLKFLGKVVPEISLTQINAMAISIARTTKGNNSKGPGPMALIFFPTIQLVILVTCTKFQVSR